MLEQNQVIVTKADGHRLSQMIKSLRASLRTVCDPYDSYLRALEGQLAGASVVSEAEVGNDIVTMNSKVCVREMDTGRCRALTLVYEADADPCSEVSSVVGPLGTSILGASLGDTVEWQPRRVPRRLRIERILFQPEAAGEFEL